MKLRDIGRSSDWYRLRKELSAPLGFAEPFMGPPSNEIAALGATSQARILAALEQGEFVTPLAIQAISNIRDGLPSWYLDAFVIFTLPRWNGRYPQPSEDLEDIWTRLYLALVRGILILIDASQFADNMEAQKSNLDTLGIVAKMLRGPLTLWPSKIERLGELVGDDELMRECSSLFADRGIIGWSGTKTEYEHVEGI